MMMAVDMVSLDYYGVVSCGLKPFLRVTVTEVVVSLHEPLADEDVVLRIEAPVHECHSRLVNYLTIVYILYLLFTIYI